MTCIAHSPDDKCPMAPLSSCAASVDTPTPSPYATDSRSFQLPITVLWHHGSNRCTPKIVKIGSFFTELSKIKGYYEAQRREGQTLPNACSVRVRCGATQWRRSKLSTGSQPSQAPSSLAAGTLPAKY